MGKKKSKSTSTTNSVQQATPPAWTVNGLQQAGGMVRDALGQIPDQHYSGQQVAFMSPEQLQAIQAAWGGTANLAGQFANQMQQEVGGITDDWNWQTALPTGSFQMAPRQELDNVISAAINPVQRQLMEQILPSITSSALESGAYSGDRAMRVLPTEALDRATESMQRIAAELGYEDYQNYENRRLAAWQSDQDRLLTAYGAETQRGLGQEQVDLNQLALMPEFMNAILKTSASQGDLLKMAADLGVNNQQQQINDALARDRYASYSPFMGLDEAAALLTALSGPWGTQSGQSTTTQKTTQSGGVLGQVLQGALGIGSMLAGFPGIGSALGLGGAAAAAAPTASSVFSGLPLIQPLPPLNLTPWPGT